MITVILDIATHRGKQVLLFKFPYNTQLIPILRKLPNATWSKTYNAWYTLYSLDVLHQVKKLFDGIAVIDASVLKESLAKLKNSSVISNSTKPNAEIETKLEQFKNWMRSRRYSDNTVNTYTEALKSFLKFCASKPIPEITNDDVIKYNTEFILKNNLSSSYQNQVVNAIKLFFRTIQNKNIDVDIIHRPKRQKLLPNVLSKEEIKAILDAPQFLKHKAMLSLIYSCGLRCGELLRLKPEHIDAKRNILIIKQSKGRKDRIAPLSDKTIKLLRTYFKAFKPSVYLFEGEKKGSPYDERSLQNVLKQSIAKAGINKPVTLHWLRHSYATHLLENGTDLRYIQEILGHSSSKTTEIYTHVSTKSIQKITTPFDSL
jgi:integrase/recombinase XerD